MKRLAFAAFLSLALCAALPAQQPSFFALSSAQPSAPPAPVSYKFDLVPALALPPSSANSVSFPSAALPDAPAPPRPSYGDDNFYRWDLGVGYEFVHFKSAPFSANLSGLHTDLTYNLYDWFGLEGNIISAWGGDILGARSKYVLYAAGARIGWGISNHRWTPWAHALVGGAHLNPQTAAGGKNGFAFQAGGGADWKWNDRVSLRAEGDYVRTMLYSSSQNNFQIGLGAVIHF
jgi:opacity protein-like surface antigen